jgi:hypothetical protein
MSEESLRNLGAIVEVTPQGPGVASPDYGLRDQRRYRPLLARSSTALGPSIFIAKC